MSTSVSRYAALALAVALVLSLAGCAHPGHRLTIEVPENASGPVEMAVTLYEPNTTKEVSQSTYSLDPGESTHVGAVKDGNSYRVVVTISGESAWEGTLNETEEACLVAHPNGTIEVVCWGYGE
jgi:type IV pilus biogenesis protein CpaD/CtpE